MPVACPTTAAQFTTNNAPVLFDEVSNSLAESVSNMMSISSPPPPEPKAEVAPPPEDGSTPMWGYDDFNLAVASSMWNDPDPFLFDL